MLVLQLNQASREDEYLMKLSKCVQGIWIYYFRSIKLHS
jgi:hypothetical protein